MPIEDEDQFEDATTYARFLRSHATTAEKILWRHLNNAKSGYKFRRQFEFDEHTFCDFCCTSVKVIVELDGEAHLGQEEKDILREKRLTDAGFLVLRFRNEEVINSAESVVSRIVNTCEGRERRRY